MDSECQPRMECEVVKRRIKRNGRDAGALADDGSSGRDEKWVDTKTEWKTKQTRVCFESAGLSEGLAGAKLEGLRMPQEDGLTV